MTLKNMSTTTAKAILALKSRQRINSTLQHLLYLNDLKQLDCKFLDALDYLKHHPSSKDTVTHDCNKGSPPNKVHSYQKYF